MNHTNRLINPNTVYRRLPAVPDVFAAEPWVLAAWLQGSFADETATHLSDVDFAVLADEAVLPVPPPSRSGLFGEDIPRMADLQTTLAGTLGVPEDVIHVVVLNRWPTEELVASLALGRLLYCRDRTARTAFEAKVFARGRPAPEEARRMVWLGRAGRIIRAVRHDPWFGFLVPACYNLGHLAVRTLGLPPPRTRFGIPKALAAAGVVPPRTAWYVWRTGVLYYAGMWLHEKGEREWSDAMFGPEWRFADWAWGIQVALERRYIEA